MASASEDNRCELTVFQCKELYIYKIPPASTIGHRAELWDVDHWLQEVSMKIVTQGEDCRIKLYDLKTGALFAECPIPNPGVAPLTTAVDSVIDSSRYFVLKLEDSSTKRHAFIGIGFRERGQASDFNAAISEHLAYVRRAREAEQMRESFASSRDSDGCPGGGSPRSSDLSLKPGETITLKLGGKALKHSQETEGSGDPAAAAGGRETQPGRPPPLLPPPIAPGAATGGTVGEAQKEVQSSQQDDWGDFVS